MTNNNNEYGGYSLFNDVESAALRTWNRCVVLFNANLTHGRDFVEGYANSLSKVERMQMMAMYQYISVKGAEEVRKEINNGEHDIMEMDNGPH